MKELAFRLKKGDDLKRSIEDRCKDLNTIVVLSSVGCVYKAHIRLANATKELVSNKDYEILSLNGTVSNGKAHLHICLSDKLGNCIGGHLMEGCLINTTCEVVLGVLEEYESNREFDENTGYDEISFKRRKVND